MGASIALGIAGISAIGSIGGAAIGASASEDAAQQQTAQEEKALQFQEQEFATQQQNQAPFVSAGQSSIGTLMNDFANGTYGPGSIAPFVAPTLAEAQATPGYQFTQQQGDIGIDAGAAAAGGAFTGGTLKALDSYNTGLANSTYNSIYANAMATYQSQLQTQAQGFNQLTSTAGLGENAAANVGNTGAQASATIGNTLGSIGSSQASGTIGAANAISSGLTGATGSLALPLYLQQLTPTNQPPYLPPGASTSSLAPGQTYNVPQQTAPTAPFDPEMD